MLYQIILALLYGHIFEYVIHKYFLHNRKRFYFAFKNHFGEHHRVARKNGMYDSSYKSIFSSKFEILSLLFAAIAHLPILYFFPYFYLTLLFELLSYYLIHRKSHLNVEWSKKWLPWHYAHHMGKDQNKNWGVRLPIFDLIFKTDDFK